MNEESAPNCTSPKSCEKFGHVCAFDQLNFDVLQDYATSNGLDFMGLCRVVCNAYKCPPMREKEKT